MASDVKKQKLDNNNNNGNKVTVVLGSQWGDEGKGKLVDDLSQNYDIVARCAGGANAGHTIVVEGKTYKFHLLPSGLISQKPICVIGNGVVVDIVALFEEIDGLKHQGIKDVESRVKVSDRAHIVFGFHKEVDALREAERAGAGGIGALGTTKKGIGPAYSSKINRSGIRVGDLVGDYDRFVKLFEASYESKKHRFEYRGGLSFDKQKEMDSYAKLIPRLKPMVIDTIPFLHNSLIEGKTILVEGANAALLDVDFGTYPYVTSSSCTVGGVCTGLGLPARSIGDVIGIMKSYTTRVGEGPFPTELTDEVGNHLQSVGAERGTTTGRVRRCGWLDLVILNYSNMLNGYSCFNLTKLDVLTGLKTIKVAVSYKYNNEILKSMPASLSVLEKVEVIYEEFPGWSEDITKIRNYKDLPQNTKNYVERVEQLLQVPIRYIGVGPGRDATIERV